MADKIQVMAIAMAVIRLEIRTFGDSCLVTNLTKVIAEEIDRFEDPEDEDPPRPGKLTRQERLQGLADSGCDTWEEYRGER